MTASNGGRRNPVVNDSAHFSEERRRMVEEQLRGRKIHDARVLDTMLTMMRCSQ